VANGLLHADVGSDEVTAAEMQLVDCCQSVLFQHGNWLPLPCSSGVGLYGSVEACVHSCWSCIISSARFCAVAHFQRRFDCHVVIPAQMDGCLWRKWSRMLTKGCSLLVGEMADPYEPLNILASLPTGPIVQALNHVGSFEGISPLGA